MPRGSIRPKPSRGDDAWEIQASAGTDPLSNRRRRVTRLVRGTRADAEQALTKLLTEIDAKPVATEGTVAHLLEVWWQQGEPGWSPSTAGSYRSIIDKRLAKDFGGMRLRDLKLEHLERYYARLRREGLKRNTVLKHHSVLRAALSKAARWGWIAANPALGARIPQDAEPTQISPPSQVEMRALIAHIDESNPELGVFVRLAADTGMRRGEVLGLRWLAVDFDRAELVVQRSVTQVGREVFDRGTTKTRQVRRIELAAPTIEVLRAHRERMVERARAGGVEVPPNGFVFSRRLDCSEPWKPDTVSHWFMRARDQVGVDARLHDVRHFMATEWLAAGVSVVVVSKRLGHAVTSTTVDVYAHVDDARGRESADRMGSLVD